MEVPEEQGLPDPSLAVLEQRNRQEIQSLRHTRMVWHAMSSMLTKLMSVLGEEVDWCAENMTFKTVIYLLYVIPVVVICLLDDEINILCLLHN